MLKDYLLSLGFFIDNNYLDQYVELMDKPFSNSAYSELHHQVPVYCYKKLFNLKNRYSATKKADSDANNKLVRLSFADHIKAHWLLSKCSCVKENECTVLYMIGKILDNTNIKRTNNSIIENGFTQEEFLEINKLKEELIDSSDYYWNEEDICWLKTNYSSYSRRYCAEYLNKTEASIHRQCKTLGLKKTSNKWTKEEDTWLQTNYNKYNLDFCVDYLGRSYNAIISRLRKFNIPLHEKCSRAKMINKIKQRHNWTKEEEVWLLKSYSTLGINGCAAFLNVSQAAIEHKINKLRNNNC